MPLSPQDIVRKEFREAFRGYNQADVDLFLDEVVEEFTRLAEENQKMKVRLAALQQEAARLRDGRAPITPAAPAGAAAASPDPQRIETEVRARLRRFFEEQLRSLDSNSVSLSSTAERIARELPRKETGAITQRQARPAPPATPEPEPATQRSREPFWAGE